jgi:hypothetical protein
MQYTAAVDPCRHDGASGKPPAEPKREGVVREAVSALLRARHCIAEPLEVADGRTGRGADPPCDVREPLRAIGKGLERGSQVARAADESVELVLEVE